MATLHQVRDLHAPNPQSEHRPFVVVVVVVAAAVVVVAVVAVVAVVVVVVVVVHGLATMMGASLVRTHIGASTSNSNSTSTITSRRACNAAPGNVRLIV